MYSPCKSTSQRHKRSATESIGPLENNSEPGRANGQIEVRSATESTILLEDTSISSPDGATGQIEIKPREVLDHRPCNAKRQETLRSRHPYRPRLCVKLTKSDNNGTSIPQVSWKFPLPLDGVGASKEM